MRYSTRTAVISLPCVLLFGGAASASGPSSAPADDADIERIVVVGTQPDLGSARREAALTPGGVQLVDIDEFRERNVSSLADVLQFVPGVWSSSDSGSDALFFSSRGSNLDATDYDLNGIKLLKDGLPITTADGSNHNRVVDPLSARHVIFARGANALKYGASTLGGAANFVSVTARSTDPLALAINGGSFGQRLARVTAAGVHDERLDALVTIENKEWHGYREHGSQHRGGLYGNLGWRLSGELATRFYATWIENDQELPGALSRAQVAADPDRANPAAVGGNYQLDVRTWRFANRTSWQIDDHRRLDFGLSLEEQSLFHPIVDQVLVDFDGIGPEPPVEVFSLLIDTDQRNAGGTLRYNHRIGDHDLLFGANYATSSTEGGNYRNLDGMPNGLSERVDNDATSLEAFAIDRCDLSDSLTLILAAQTVSASREVRSMDVETGSLRNPEAEYSSFNPRIGLIYGVREDVELYANVSRLFEPPTNFELEDNVAGGDATLDAMEGTVVEIGARGGREPGAGNGWSWDVSLYHARVGDEILSIDDPAAPGTSLSSNVDDTIHAGIEAVARAWLALDADAGRYLEPVVSVTVNRFELVDDLHYDNNRLPAAPTHVVRGEIMYRDDRGFYAGPTFEIVGERYADFVNSYRIDGYTLAGLRGGWSGRRWSVYAEVQNLLDERYVATHDVRDVAAPDAEILNPGAPLSAYVGIRWRLR